MSRPEKPLVTEDQPGRADVPVARAGVRRITIGGRLLGELQMRISGENSKYISSRAFPPVLHSITEDAGGITVSMPALAALQAVGF